VACRYQLLVTILDASYWLGLGVAKISHVRGAFLKVDITDDGPTLCGAGGMWDGRREGRYWHLGMKDPTFVTTVRAFNEWTLKYIGLGFSLKHLVLTIFSIEIPCPVI
jgi:hypothetical protein